MDAIHANYVDVTVDRSLASYGRCMSDVSSGVMDTLHAIELENLKANSMWKRYLSNDTSPITDVFAGQLQIVRSCQKCHSRSSTYEPFWDLSLSLSKEKTSWFNPGRMPSSLDDLLKAFTAAEVLQGEDAPFCEDCDQKSPATRRILIHRFPKVLVINIKRFKYTKDGREKLTSNVSFPVRGLRLQVNGVFLFCVITFIEFRLKGIPTLRHHGTVRSLRRQQSLRNAWWGALHRFLQSLSNLRF